MTGIETILEYLTTIPAWFLATCEEDQPHVRPFSFAAQQEGKIWFCTATNKDVYHELTINPKFELSAWKPGSGWLILRGSAGLEDRVSDKIRQDGYEHMLGLGEYYESAHDPLLTFFSVENPQAWICDIDGSWNSIDL